MTADQTQNQDEAVEAMEALGFREYEARCFVTLSRLPAATARDIGELTDIPRTRVYDAMDELADKGLVSVHFSTPKQFRAVATSDAVDWFKDRFDRQLSRFERNLQSLPELDTGAVRNESSVWSVSGTEGTLIRVSNLIQNANHDVVLYIDGEDQLNKEVLKMAAKEDGLDVTVFTATAAAESFVESIVDDETTVTRFELPRDGPPGEDTTGHSLTIVLADGQSAVVRTQMADLDSVEEAVVAEGRDNSIVHWLRTLFGR